MDPLLATLILFWLVRRAIEDGWAGIHGRTSPRIERRRAQHELEQKRRADLGRPTLGQAVAGRVVQRIAEPRERGAARRYFAELWDDAWVDAATSHREKRKKRARKAEQQAEVIDVQLCPECRLRWVTPPWTHCIGCERDQAERQSPPAAPADDEAPIPDEPIEAQGDVVDLGPDTEPIYMGQPVDDIPARPEPTPVPETDRKDTPMTTPSTINGDTVSPLENLGYADACREFNQQVVIKLDTLANNLAGVGFGAEYVQIIRDAHAGGQAFDTSTVQAQTEYAEHVRVQAELLGDIDLRDTLDDTYLAARGA